MTFSADHRAQAEQEKHSRSVCCAVLTVSDTRTLQTDVGGPLIVEQLIAANHLVAARAIVKDEPAEIHAQLEQWIGNQSIQAIMVTGGTGISRRDTTIEVVRKLMSVELEGFGELFRMLSYEEVKSSAMMSRAAAGLVVRDASSGGDTLIFAMPGSPNAVKLAMQKLITPELAHLVWERRR